MLLDATSSLQNEALQPSSPTPILPPMLMLPMLPRSSRVLRSGAYAALCCD